MGMDNKREASSTWRETFRALRHRNYQLFFAGQLISLIGTWMDQVAESWLVYRLTGSALLLGTVAFASQIPVFLLAPIGGAVADRVDRRKILVVTQTSMMLLTFVLAWLTLSHRVQIWHIVTLAALTGVVNALDLPARQAFVVDMVAREDLVNAIALNSSMFNGARIVGPSLAGIVVAAIGEGWCFFANGVSFIAVIAGLLLMRIDRPRLAIEGSPLENILEGFRFVAGTGPVRALMLLLGLVSFTAMPYAVLMPLLRHGRAGWCAHARHAKNRIRTRRLGGGFLRWFRRGPAALRLFPLALALLRAAAPGGILHNDPDGLVQHAYTEHGA
jgi:MFS family permease